jgi:hypothetical protein
LRKEEREKFVGNFC